MLWIKEVEMVESVDDLKSSCSARGSQMPNFEVLYAKIASALNSIIHNTQLKRRISLEKQKAQKEDRFLRGRQIAHLIYESFQVTGAKDSVENYADIFAAGIRNDDIQEFDSKWDGILLSMRRTVSFVEDRSLTSTSTSGLLEPMILSRIVPTCLQLFLEMTIFRNSIRNGTEFYCL